MYLVVSLFGFEGRMWDLIVSVPDHCLSFYLFKMFVLFVVVVVFFLFFFFVFCFFFFFFSLSNSLLLF